MRRKVNLLLVGPLAGVLSACGPSDECRRYVACQRDYDPSIDTSPWDEGGVCWGAFQTAQACTSQCAGALRALQQVPNAPASCSEGAAAADDGG